MIARIVAVVPSGSCDVELGAAVDQRLRRVERADARRVHQRRHAADRQRRLAARPCGRTPSSCRRRRPWRPPRAAASPPATWFSAAAHISAVSPNQRSCALGSAPRASSMRMASTLPVRDAVISTVSPSGVAPFASAPACSSASMIARVAVLGGQLERRRAVAVRPALVAPARSSACTSSRSPTSTAQCSGVVPSGSAWSHAACAGGCSASAARSILLLDRVDERGVGARGPRRPRERRRRRADSARAYDSARRKRAPPAHRLASSLDQRDTSRALAVTCARACRTCRSRPPRDCRAACARASRCAGGPCPASRRRATSGSGYGPCTFALLMPLP